MLIYLIGANPEEQQRLHMLGTLEDEIFKVSQRQQCSSYLCSDRLNPVSGAIGVLWWTQERSPRERHSPACPRSLASHDRTGCVSFATRT